MHQPESRQTPVSCRILLAEDEVLIRHDLAQRLRLAGLEVVEARNADEAMALLAIGAAPFLLITDVHPGPNDGLHLARFARLWNSEIKIIVVSGRITEAEVSGLADAAFAKPFDAVALVAKVQDMIELGRDGREQDVA